MRKENPEEILKKAGLKKTAGRIAVLELLLEARNPLSRQEISEKLPPSLNFNYVSVYRALQAFLRAGLVHRVGSGDWANRYAVCGCDSQGHCHPHFICNSCGLAECLQEIRLPLYNQKEVKQGYVVEEQEFYLRGLCRDCSNAVGSE